MSVKAIVFLSDEICQESYILLQVAEKRVEKASGIFSRAVSRKNYHKRTNLFFYKQTNITF